VSGLIFMIVADLVRYVTKIHHDHENAAAQPFLRAITPLAARGSPGDLVPAMTKRASTGRHTDPGGLIS
jgi:hypothetical protein